ncbi:MAG: hypothetical protein QXP36_03120 [Conexivisphaerales archaeon]
MSFSKDDRLRKLFFKKGDLMFVTSLLFLNYHLKRLRKSSFAVLRAMIVSLILSNVVHSLAKKIYVKTAKSLNNGNFQKIVLLKDIRQYI